jgi:hypothetical protein
VSRPVRSGSSLGVQWADAVRAVDPPQVSPKSWCPPNNFSDTRISLFSEATISTDGCALPNQAHRMITLFFENGPSCAVATLSAILRASSRVSNLQAVGVVPLCKIS